MLSVCPSPSSSSSSTSSPRVATSARLPSCCVYVHPPPLPHPHHQPISTPRFAPSERQKGQVHDSLPCSVSILLLLLLTIISNLPQQPELTHQHGLVHGGLPALCVHHSLPPPPPHHHHLKPTSTTRVAPSAPPGARRPSCSLCPSFSSSSFSSSPSSQTYLNTPSCPISTAWCTAAFLLSVSIILFLIIIIIIIIIISNLPQYPELPHQHRLVHGGLLALYVSVLVAPHALRRVADGLRGLDPLTQHGARQVHVTEVRRQEQRHLHLVPASDLLLGNLRHHLKIKQWN